MKVYIIGSLRNPAIPALGILLREAGHEVFDDWFAGGERADDAWMAYEKARGRHYREALYGEAAHNIFQFDKRHLDSADAAVLVLPAGRSGHLELGYMAGKGRQTIVYFAAGEPERWDVMYQFASAVAFSAEEVANALDVGETSQVRGIAADAARNGELPSVLHLDERAAHRH